jgi:hypothetical protein
MLKLETTACTTKCSVCNGLKQLRIHDKSIPINCLACATQDKQQRSLVDATARLAISGAVSLLQRHLPDREIKANFDFDTDTLTITATPKFEEEQNK